MLANKALSAAPAAVVTYVEDVFSTYLYTGTDSTQSITNNVDLSGSGGMVWIKARSSAFSHRLFDTNRGATKELYSNAATGEVTTSTSLTAFNNNGFTIGGAGGVNNNGTTYASWSFRQQEKFFDVVTYSGDGNDNRAISHSLGATPGCVIVARRSGDDWFVYHRSLSANDGLRLNKTDSASSNTATVKSVSSTTFTVGTDGMVNASGSDYVAYLFAHDAGGFGASGSDSVIKCGSFTTSTNAVTDIDLGWEPQWVLVKASNKAQGWFIYDIMRGFPVTNTTNNVTPGGISLSPNTSAVESVPEFASLTNSGFKHWGQASDTYIYIAIRRGPMKTPEAGTEVYQGTVRTGTAATASITGLAFPPDFVISRNRPSNGNDNWAVFDKLRGATKYLITNATSAETTGATSLTSFNQAGVTFGDSGIVNANGDSYINYQMRRAPGFFDVVCYTGTGSNLTVNHNLGVAPELIIIKSRSNTSQWTVNYSFTASGCGEAGLNLNSAGVTLTYAAGPAVNAQPTSTQFQANSPTSSYTYVAYLFASLSGVSKIGTYTGNGTSQTINCGFTNGARFILIKRTDSAANWFVFDTARGIVAGNDPYLKLNLTNAEVTGKDAIDPDNSGFIVVYEASDADVNDNGGTYIYLAIA